MTQVVILMGVAGSGKTTVGRRLAESIGWSFEDADDYHDASSLEKIRRGDPLTDFDRAPWLERLGALIQERAREGPPTVLACSALKRSYRTALGADRPDVAVFWLDVLEGVLERRLRSRTGHVAGADLLPSQLSTLETPLDAVRLDGNQRIEDVVREARSVLDVE
jgi:gluconokinase